MRRLLFVLLLACLGIGQSHAQLSVTGVGGGFGAGGGFTPSCTASSNFLARANGITLTADKTNYDTLICGLNTDGVLAKLDALYIFAAPDATTARLNLVQNAFNASEVGSVTFSQYHGFTGNGSTGYEDTGFNPFLAAGHFSQNNGMIGAYVLSSRTTSQAWREIGAEGVNFSFLVPTLSGNFTYGVNTVTPANPVNSNAQGSWAAFRTSSSAITLYKNGVQFDAQAANTSGSVDNDNIFVLASDLGGGAPGGFSQDQLSSAIIGGGLTSTDVANLQSRLNTFMTAYGINVY